MSDKKVHFMKIDAETFTRTALLQALMRKKETVAIREAGPYRQDDGYFQVWVDSVMCVSEMEEWLVSLKNIETVGVVPRHNYRKSEGYLFDSLEAVPITNPDFINPKLIHLYPEREIQ